MCVYFAHLPAARGDRVGARNRHDNVAAERHLDAADGAQLVDQIGLRARVFVQGKDDTSLDEMKWRDEAGSTSTSMGREKQAGDGEVKKIDKEITEYCKTLQATTGKTKAACYLIRLLNYIPRKS